MRRGLWLAGALFVCGCAPIPRPSVLGDVEAVEHGAAAEEARTFAPAALAHAQKVEQEAKAAFDAHDLAGSQLLGERALAAYAHALALARIAKAEAGRDESEAKLTAAKSDMAGLDVEQARVGGEADNLEMRLRVLRDAEPVEASGRADPDREKARQAAARSLALQARLLCAGARMLTASLPTPSRPSSLGATPPPASSAPPAAGSPPVADASGTPSATSPPAAPASITPPVDPRAQVDDAVEALDAIDAQLGTTPRGQGGGKAPRAASGPTPIDAAMRARAGCLAALSAVRRVATPVTRAPGVGDALLAEMSAEGRLTPSRDDRGVFVTLRGLFATGAKHGLTEAGQARVDELGRIAAAHPAFPVEVVVHGDRPLSPRDEADELARGQVIAKAISAAAKGLAVEVVVAGNRAPVVDPAGRDKARNARVEVVFVTPESL